MSENPYEKEVWQQSLYASLDISEFISIWMWMGAENQALVLRGIAEQIAERPTVGVDWNAQFLAISEQLTREQKESIISEFLQPLIDFLEDSDEP